MDESPGCAAPLELVHATSLVGRLVFGDAGVGGIPLGGDVALAVGHGESWQGKLSTSALDAVEVLWAQREQAGRVTDDEAVAIAKAAFQYDMDFYGLAIDWDGARLEVLGGGLAVRVLASVRSAALLEADVRRAMVRLELVDGAATYAEFVLSDGDEIEVFEREELDPGEYTSPSIDSMTRHCRTSLEACLVVRRLPEPAFWLMGFASFPRDGGRCEELRVWTTVRP